MAVKVKWAIFDQGNHAQKFPGLQIICLEPEPLLKLILDKRRKSLYTKCYALLDALKNTYVICAPIDLTMQYDKEAKWLHINGADQEIYSNFFKIRASDCEEEYPTSVSCFATHLFYADEDVQATIWPVPILGEIENTRTIVGGFNISKWIRPLEWAFDIVDSEKPITIKRGDPLFAVVFAAKNDEKIELERVQFDPSLFNAASACVSAKNIMQKIPLHKCYKMAESFLQVWRKNRK